MSITDGDPDPTAEEVLAPLLELIDSPNYIPGLEVVSAEPTERYGLRIVFTHTSRPGRRYVLDTHTDSGAGSDTWSELALWLQEKIESGGGLPRRGKSDPIPI